MQLRVSTPMKMSNRSTLMTQRQRYQEVLTELRQQISTTSLMMKKLLRTLIKNTSSQTLSKTYKASLQRIIPINCCVNNLRTALIKSKSVESSTNVQSMDAVRCTQRLSTLLVTSRRDTYTEATPDFVFNNMYLYNWNERRRTQQESTITFSLVNLKLCSFDICLNTACWTEVSRPVTL